jgi:hypothetical protein
MTPNLERVQERRATLRYGVLLDSMTVPRWQALVLDELDRVPGVELVVVGSNLAGRARPSVSELWARRRLAWTVFNRTASRGATSLTPVDLTERLGGVHVVELPVNQQGSWQEFDADACGALRENRPDFLLRLGFGLIRGPILDVAPLGVWSFHHGDERAYRGGPPAFWELVEQADVTGVLLQRLNEQIDAGTPLGRAFFPTVPHSYRQNRDQAYLGAVQLPAQACRRVLAGDESFVHGAVSSSDAPVRRPPDVATLARFLPHHARAWIRRQVHGLTAADRWHVGVTPRPIETFLDHPSLDDVEWFPRPPGAERYVADPFGCAIADGSVVLVEDFNHRERHGRLSAYHLSETGAASEPTPVHEFEVHASYPYLLESEGDWWCIPETSAARNVVAHRFDPETLRLHDPVALLDDVALVDPTVFEWAGHWWLFGTDRDRGANTHLRAWWAPSLLGPWQPHAIDPLLIDVRSARGAGTPFVHDGRLYRPAQDCTGSYGEAVTLNLIEELDPQRFSERVVQVLHPDPAGPYPDGVHTLSSLGDRTLVDGTVRRFSLAAFRHELVARAARLISR